MGKAAEIVIESAALYSITSVAYIIVEGLGMTSLSYVLESQYLEVIFSNTAVSCDSHIVYPNVFNDFCFFNKGDCTSIDDAKSRIATWTFKR